MTIRKALKAVSTTIARILAPRYVRRFWCRKKLDHLQHDPQKTVKLRKGDRCLTYHETYCTDFECPGCAPYKANVTKLRTPLAPGTDPGPQLPPQKGPRSHPIEDAEWDTPAPPEDPHNTP